MTVTHNQTSFVSGELSPKLFGRVDFAKYQFGCSTMRNFFVNVSGGASSRAGFAYIGTCLQSGDALPPRDIKFQFNINQGYALEFGNFYMRIKSNGAYVTETAKNITNAQKINGITITSNSHGYSNGDWVQISGVGGINQINNLIWKVANATTNTFSLLSMFGANIDATTYGNYTSGGTVARIYTVASPYAVADLPYLKTAQSADIMSLTCVNTATGFEYPPYDLTRFSLTNWVFSQTTFSVAINPPATVTSVASASTTINTWYSYVVTAIGSDGTESVPSNVTTVQNNNIAVYAGSNTITWSAVAGAISYNVYVSTPSYNLPVPIGSSFGYIGSAFGTQFTDGNISADFTKTPPIRFNPFARGKIEYVSISAQGSGYSQGTVGFTINTSTGSGFAGTPIVLSGAIVGFYIKNNGENYAATDTITFTGGTGATGALTFGAFSGTYPSVVSYYQQRRVYANTLNEPNTYFFSQSGQYTNMDYSTPTIDSDAITGTPWAQQINGIQWFVPMPNGLIVLTGNGGWLLSGASNSALTPSSQFALQQGNIGASSLVEPILINADILYIQQKNSVLRNVTYNFYNNIYTGEDKTILANHLFFGHEIKQWAYSEEPYKVIWCVREDGILLSLTWLKEQDVWAWSRHDTDGLVVSVCTVTEPPVDAVYIIVKRYVQGQWLYYSERIDNRIWNSEEDAFCVDSGLKYSQNYPNATLMPALYKGTNNITGANIILGGSNYTSPQITAVDSTGAGSGGVFSATLSGGVITGINIINAGTNYTAGYTIFKITDATGSGANIQPIITNKVTFNASASIFSAGNVGDVIRVGNGKATVTDYVSGTQIIADITQNITDVIANDPNQTPVPAIAGKWTITTPVSTITGLNHLNGKLVSIVADGSVVPSQVVTNNTITLPNPSSAIFIGLPYTCQLQTMYLDLRTEIPSQTKRKTINAVGVRVEATRGISIGSDQVDSSTLPNGEAVEWTNMAEIKERNANNFPGNAIKLYTGDYYQNIVSNWKTNGQIAIQQKNPLPANILSCVAYYTLGDTSG
jgi:hypothetical protein